jgi:putative ABC transport system permease protein
MLVAASCAFAALTLAPAIVGVYGVTSAVAVERTREYGIRLALGATSQRVNRHVLTRSALPLGIGIAAVLVLAGWASRFVTSLYGVVPLDGWSFAAAAAVVFLCGLVAASIPARRAGRVDPIVALRAE